jgi:hypothetical protein
MSPRLRVQPDGIVSNVPPVLGRRVLEARYVGSDRAGVARSATDG